MNDKGIEDIPSITNPEAIRARAAEMQSTLVEPTNLRTRKIKLKDWTSRTIRELMDGVTLKRMHPTEDSIRYQYSLIRSNNARALATLLTTAAKKLVFDDPRIKTLESKRGRIIRCLYREFCQKTELLPLDFQELLDSGRGTKERIVADFVSGMTDRYAYSYYNRLFQPGIGSFYEYV